MEDDKNLQEVDAAYDDAEEVFLEEPETESEPKKKKKKEKKQKVKKDKKTPKAKEPKVKKPLTKNQKVVIIAVSIVLFFAILITSIAVPVSLSRRGKIFVSRPEDFQNTSDGDIFVLNADIITKDLTLGNLSNIDFNGHSLVVSGTLTIDNKSDKPVMLGTDAKTGTLDVGKLLIKSKSEVALSTILKAKSLDITAPSVLVKNGISLSENSVITASNIGIYDNIAFTNKNTDQLALKGVLNVNISAIISGDLSIYDDAVSEVASKIYITGDVDGDILASHNTELSIESKVTGKVDTNDTRIVDDKVFANTKIEKVIIGTTAFVRELYNAELVIISQEAIYPNMRYVDEVKVRRQLDRVGYISIDEVGAQIILSFTPVKDADAYIVTIDDKKYNLDNGETFLNITEYVDDWSTHRITIQAISKSNEDTLEPSKLAIYEYSSLITLSRATNIKVDVVDGKYMLSFDKVPFAEEYNITINGKDIKHFIDAKKIADKTTNSLSVDITDYVCKTVKKTIKDDQGKDVEKEFKIPVGGTYIIEIVANSKKDNIRPSKPAVYKYDINLELDSFYVTVDRKDEKISLTWDKVEGAKYYELILYTLDGEKIIYRTTGNSFSIDEGLYQDYEITPISVIAVRAVSNNPYYSPSIGIEKKK